MDDGSVVFVDAIVLFACHRHREIVSLLAVHGDLNFWILQSPVVPGSGPMMGGHVEMTTAHEARENPVACGSVRSRRSEGEGLPGLGLEVSEHGLEDSDEARVGQEDNQDSLDGPDV